MCPRRVFFLVSFQNAQTASALLAALRAAPWLPRLVAALPFALAAIGAATVAHWAAVDDLRAYFIVQFYPLLTIPALLWLFPAHYSHAHRLVGALGWYALAKAAEVADRPVFRATCGLVSGHTLKHLIASLSMLWCIFFIVERRPLA